MVMPAGTVPLQHGEFGAMPAPRLIITEHGAELVNRPAASRQQTLHGQFRRSVHVTQGLSRKGLQFQSHALYIGVRSAGRGQGGSAYLHDLTLREEIAYIRQ